MRYSTIAPLLAALPAVFAIPEQPKIDTTNTPKHFGVVVFPGYQALDAFGPLDILNTFSMLFDNKMHLSVISATLDPVNTVPPPRPGMNMVHGTFGEKIVPTNTFAEILANNGTCGSDKPVPDAPVMPHGAKRDEGQGHGHGDMAMSANDTKGPIEVLIVPGGGGTRGNMSQEIDFVKQMYPKVKQVISICTGATILSRAGILDGRNATSNKRAWEWVLTQGPNVNWVHQARWVEDGNIWTSSGISAGMDVTYAWLAATYGEETANYVAISSEYERWTDASYDPFAATWDNSTAATPTPTPSPAPAATPAGYGYSAKIRMN